MLAYENNRVLVSYAGAGGCPSTVAGTLQAIQASRATRSTPRSKSSLPNPADPPAHIGPLLRAGDLHQPCRIKIHRPGGAGVVANVAAPRTRAVDELPFRLILSWLAPAKPQSLPMTLQVDVGGSLGRHRQVADGAFFEHQVGGSIGDHRELIRIESVDAAVDASGNGHRCQRWRRDDNPHTPILIRSAIHMNDEPVAVDGHDGREPAHLERKFNPRVFNALLAGGRGQQRYSCYAGRDEKDENVPKSPAFDSFSL